MSQTRSAQAVASWRTFPASGVVPLGHSSPRSFVDELAFIDVMAKVVSRMHREGMEASAEFWANLIGDAVDKEKVQSAGQASWLTPRPCSRGRIHQGQVLKRRAGRP